MTLASKTKKHDPTYYLTVTTRASSSSANPSTRQLKAPFTTWFTADGYFVAQPFQKWLAGSVNVIGEEDVKNASVDEKVLAPSPNGAAMATSVDTPTSSSKRNKKKG